MNTTITMASSDGLVSEGSLKRWTVVLASSLLFFYSFMQLNSLNSIGAYVMRDFMINASQLGNLSSMYFYGNFILLFPAGLILDRFSTRKVILVAMLMAVVSMFGFGLAHNVVIAGIYRFISGLAGAFCMLSCVRLASRWFPAKQMAFVTGCLVTVAMLGAMVAQTPLELLSEAWGWRQAMVFAGFLGIGCTILVWLFVKDHPGDIEKQDVVEQQKAEEISYLESLRRVVTNHYNWLGGLYTAMINLPIFLLGALWGGMYLVQVEHLTHVEASYVTSMLFLGTIIGGPLAGLLSDRIERRRLPMLVGAVLSLAIVLLVIYIPSLSLYSLMFLFFMMGVVTSTQVLSYPTVTELNSPLVTGTALSIISITVMASGFIFQPFFGWLMDLHWRHMVLNNVAIYSPQDYRLAMIIMPIAFVISLAAAFLIKETKCRRQ